MGCEFFYLPLGYWHVPFHYFHCRETCYLQLKCLFLASSNCRALSPFSPFPQALTLLENELKVSLPLYGESNSDLLSMFQNSLPLLFKIYGMRSSGI